MNKEKKKGKKRREDGNVREKVFSRMKGLLEGKGGKKEQNKM